MTWYDDLSRIRGDLEANETAARALIEGLTEQQLNWQAQPGSTWSILQCLDHLALSNRHYTAAMRGRIHRCNQADFPAKGPIRPTALGALFLKNLEPPVSRRLRAPKAIVPRPASDSGEVLTAFLHSHDDIRAAMDEAAGLDLNRIKFRNPLLPVLRVRVGTGLLIMAAHERRHLWQAGRVRKALQAADG